MLTLEEVLNWENRRYYHGCTAAVVSFLTSRACGFLPGDHRQGLFGAIHRVFQHLTPALLTSLQFIEDSSPFADLMAIPEAGGSKHSGQQSGTDEDCRSSHKLVSQAIREMLDDPTNLRWRSSQLELCLSSFAGSYTHADAADVEPIVPV